MKNNQEKKIRKGGMVKLNEECVARLEDRFTFEPEGSAYLTGTSVLSRDEQQAWREERRKLVEEAIAAGEDTWHLTMQDDGESRLPPTSTNVRIYPGRAYQVLRARAVGHWNYHRHPGQCLILDLETGREVYIDRRNLEAV